MSGDAARIQTLFGGDAFKFARWGGAICPMVVGLDDKGARLFEEAIGAVASLAGVPIEEIDPEMGANFLVYVMGDWSHAARAPNLPNFLPDLPALVERLNEANANRYRVFAFDDQGAIRASITLLRYDEQMQAAPVDYIALTEAALGMLVFDERGVSEDRPVIMAKFDDDEEARAVLTPWHAMLMRAAYDPAIPAGSKDPALAMRLAARIMVQSDDEDEDDEEDGSGHGA
ncbi:MAG: hypothetical protein AAF360_08285 [Pseudomonadota bacterium]